jgi:hypothetical protein
LKAPCPIALLSGYLTQLLIIDFGIVAFVDRHPLDEADFIHAGPNRGYPKAFL